MRNFNRSCLILVTAGVLLVAWTPVAAAGFSDCSQAAVAEPGSGVSAGVYAPPCAGAGASVQPPGTYCLTVLWGHHTDAYGVGGGNSCHATVWANASRLV